MTNDEDETLVERLSLPVFAGLVAATLVAALVIPLFAFPYVLSWMV